MRSKNPHYPTSAITGRERCPSPIQFFRQLLVAAAVLFCPLVARGQGNGSLDTSFDPDVNNTVRAVVVQADGKALIGGLFTQVGGIARNRIARLNPDGSVDTTFNPGSGADGPVYTVVLQADGRVLIAGAFTQVNGVTRSGFARLNADGSLDLSFAPSLVLHTATPPDTAYGPADIATQSDGKMIVVGGFNRVNGVERNRIARLNADGSLDPSLDPGTSTDVWGIGEVATQPDGKVLIGGNFYVYNGVPRNSLARVNSDGSLDTSFANGLPQGAYVLSLVRQPDGKVLLGGAVGPGQIVRLNADGSRDTSFGPGSGANNYVWSVGLQSDGKVLIGGYFTQFNGVARNRIARLNANGSLDTSFHPGSGANNNVLSVAVQPDGKVLIGGVFTQVNGVTRNRIARLGSRTFVLAIGVNFQGIQALRGGNSAYAVAAGFARFVGVENVEVLELESPGNNNGDLLTERIRLLFDSENPQRLRPGDTLVFHINTHGGYEDYSGSGGEADEVPVSAQFNVHDFSARRSSSADELLYLDNVTRIKDDTLQYLFSDDSPDANEVNKLFLVDACFAGGMFGSTNLGDSGDLSVLPRTAVIAASPEGDYSFFDPVARIGWFSKALSKALTSMADSGATNLNFDALVAALTAQLADYRNRPGRISGIEDDWEVDVTGDLNPVSGKSTDFEWLVAGPNPPHLISAASRKIHGSTAFDINLPLTGNPGVECRSSGGCHTLVFTFINDVVSGDADVTIGTGLAGSPTFAGNTMTVSLSGVADVQKITVTLSNVTDNFAQVLPDTAVSMNVLVGDTTGSKSVNSSDVSQTKLQSGVVVSQANCRQDVTANGVINSSDVSLVKLRSGSGLP